MPQAPGSTAANDAERWWRTATPVEGESTVQGWRRRGVFAGLTAIALSLGLFHIGRPAPSADEAATMLAVNRSWEGLFGLLEGKDAVHVPYYALAKLWAFGEGTQQLISVRMLSAGAMALAAGGLYLLVARRLGIVLGATTALLLCGMPGVWRFAQEARPFALLVLATVLAWLTWEARHHPMERALGAPPPPSPTEPPDSGGNPGGADQGDLASRRGALWYGLALAGTGLINLFGLLQWPAQVLADLTTAELTVRQRVRRAIRTIVVMVTALAVIGYPVAVGALRGTGPMAETPLTPRRAAATFIGTLAAFESKPEGWVATAVVVALALIAVGSAVANRAKTDQFREMARIAVIWFAVPLVSMLAIGLLRPNLVRRRYWLPMLPPLSVLAVIGLAILAQLAFRLVLRFARGERRSVIAGVATAVVTMLPVGVLIGTTAPLHLDVRADTGHGNAMAKLLKELDAVVAQDPSLPILVRDVYRAAIMRAVRPELTERNLLMRFPEAGDRIWPTEVAPEDLVLALEGHSRVLWVEGRNTMRARPKTPPPQLGEHGFDIVSVAKAEEWWIIRLAR